MKQQYFIYVVFLAFLFITGCSEKLDAGDVNKLLTRFVAEHKYVREKSNDTGVLGNVGPILINGNEATVDFSISYERSLTEKLSKGVETAKARFIRTQDGKWIFAQVRGSTWGMGWWTEPGELNYEVK